MPVVLPHIRDETYSKELAELINFQHRIPFSEHWGEGTTSPSDGQRFRAGGRGEAAGQVNANMETTRPLPSILTCCWLRFGKAG